MLNNSNIRCGVILTILSLILTCSVSAEERIGNLIFKTMNTLKENHHVFMKDLNVIRKNLSEACAKRDAIKQNFKKADPGSLERRELHAELSLALAGVYHTIYDEAVLTHDIAKKQIGVLTKLNEQVKSGETVLNDNTAKNVIELSKPLLINGRSLLNSLAQYRDKISDPAINSKLNSAHNTAKTLSQFVSKLETGRASQFSSQKILRQKLSSLIDQLTALYVQTSILKDMIKDKSLTLRLINQLAAAETVIIALGDGEKTSSELIDQVMGPMVEELNSNEENLNLLATPLHSDGDIISAEASKFNQSWTSGF